MKSLNIDYDKAVGTWEIIKDIRAKLPSFLKKRSLKGAFCDVWKVK